MRRDKGLHMVTRSLAAHPYLWTLAICLYCEPFIFGTDYNIANYVLWSLTLMTIGLAVVYAMYLHRSEQRGAMQIAILGISIIMAICFVARLYAQSQVQNSNFSGAWTAFAIGISILVIYLVFRCACNTQDNRLNADLKEHSWETTKRGRAQTSISVKQMPGISAEPNPMIVSKEHRLQFNALAIISMGFLLKLFYVIITSIYTRQQDVGAFDINDNHAGYIEYLLANHALPDFDIRGHWQLYHPPLHHAISAAWIYLNEDVLSIGHDAARESLQTLTLFYSMCIVISAYRIMRYFNLRGYALYIPLILVSFHPSFTILSGSINNDVLSVAFIVGSILATLEWYRIQTTIGIIKIALCVGFGMMTKLSAAVVAPPIALLFIWVFFKKEKPARMQVLTQFLCFAAVCVPLALWFGIRNYITWGVPLTYVPRLSNEADQYLGSMSFFARITDFSPHQFDSPYIHWALYEEGCYEFNPLIAPMKSALFGELMLINENSILGGDYAETVALVFFWINAAIAVFAFVSMIIVCVRKLSPNRIEALFLATFYTVLMVGFYKMTADYPFTCTMNFRYITPTVVVGAVFVGLFLQSEVPKNNRMRRVITSLAGAGTFSFAALSSFVYLAI